VKLHASLKVQNLAWKELYSAEGDLTSAPDSTQRIFSLPGSLFLGSDHLLFVELSLSDPTGKTVSRNFYWVPTTTTTFDWPRTDYTHTPAARHEDLTALAHLPQATVETQAEIVTAGDGREVELHLKNTSGSLAFQIHADVRTAQGELIAPAFWTDNWIELAPGESTTLKAVLPASDTALPTVHVEGWNVAATALTPAVASASHLGK
jgi:exo-1,4-beta-D-glucosaminidase